MNEKPTRIRFLVLFVVCLVYFITYLDRVNIAVAAPIFNAAGELAGAVGAVMPAERYWTDGLWEKFKSETRNTAESISFAIGYPLPE